MNLELTSLPSLLRLEARVLRARLISADPLAPCVLTDQLLSACDSGPPLPSFSLVIAERFSVSMFVCACPVSLNAFFVTLTQGSVD